MIVKTYWKFILSTVKESKIKEVEKYIKEIVGEANLITYDKYWKDKSQFILEYEEIKEVDNKQEIIYLQIRKCSSFSNNWNFILPDLESDFSLSGVSENNISNKFISWVNIELG